jgi:hypothetical protein
VTDAQALDSSDYLVASATPPIGCVRRT